jgi:hypothetical protein
MVATSKRLFSGSEAAFAVFAELHPHEAHTLDPDRFWSHFQKRCPGVSRTAMEALLHHTDQPEDTP